MKVYDDELVQQKINDAASSGFPIAFENTEYKISQRFAINDGVDFPMFAFPLFTCVENPDAGFDISEKIYYGEQNIPRHRFIGNFRINGNGIATHPLYIGYNSINEIRNIDVSNSANIGVIIDELQNSAIYNLHSHSNSNVNLIIDNSCRSLQFYSAVLSTASEAGLIIRHSGNVLNVGGQNGAVIINKLIDFYSLRIEWIDSKAGVLIQDATDVTFQTLNTSSCGVILTKNEKLDRITFSGGELANSGGTCLSVTGGTNTHKIRVRLTNQINFESGAIGIYKDAYANVVMSSFTKGSDFTKKDTTSIFEQTI